MEHVDQDLNSMLRRKTNFSRNHLVKIVYNMLCSIDFLHQANVMHRDLKPANLLINTSCNIKICDLGLSRSIPSQNMGLRGYNSMSVRDHFFETHQDELISKYDVRDYIQE